MADESYKISLGVDVDVSNIQSQINTKTKDTTVPIKVEIENLKDIKEQLQNLGKSKGNKNLLSFDTTSLENSLKDVSNTIKDIKAYKPMRNSISAGQVLHCPYDYKKTKLIIKEMSDLLALDLVSKKLVTNQLILTVGYDVENLTNPEIKRKY